MEKGRLTIRYSHLVYGLFALFILWIPLNSVYDTIAFFNGTVGDKTFAQTPIYFKVFKDFFLAVAIAIATHAMFVCYLHKRLLSFLAFLIFVVIFALASLSYSEPIAVTLGLRSYLIVFFVFIGFYFYDIDLLRLYPLLRFVFFVELTVQILQFFYAPNYYGYVLGPFNLTNPGTFLIPSTMASYALIVHYYARKSNDAITMCLTILSVLLTQSSTAWMIVIFYYVIRLFKNTRLSFGVLMLVCSLLAVIIYFNLDALTGRPDIVNNLVTRIQIFTQHVDSPFGKGFGLGSGAAVLLHLDDAIIADSTVNSLLINFGWIGLGIYIFFIVVSIKYFSYHNLLFICFVCFSLTMIIFEMTPFIQFYFFELGSRIRNSTRHSESSLQWT
jgi:hypothetical protein